MYICTNIRRRNKSLIIIRIFQSSTWDKFRLLILKRDKYTCRDCKATDVELHVHHTYYIPGNRPWQYPLDSLITLCYNCHKIRHDKQDAKDLVLSPMELVILRDKYSDNKPLKRKVGVKSFKRRNLKGKGAPIRHLNFLPYTGPIY